MEYSTRNENQKHMSLSNRVSIIYLKAFDPKYISGKLSIYQLPCHSLVVACLHQFPILVLFENTESFSLAEIGRSNPMVQKIKIVPLLMMISSNFCVPEVPAITLLSILISINLGKKPETEELYILRVAPVPWSSISKGPLSRECPVVA